MKKTKLAGTWKLVSFNYTQADGKPDESVKIKTAIRVYNDTHFTVFYDYENGTTETCLSKYSLDDEKLEMEILFHTEPGYAGQKFVANSSITNNKLTHKMEIEGYKIEEHYERME